MYGSHRICKHFQSYFKPIIFEARVVLFFRQYVAPLLIVMVFLVAMVAVSARAFLPGDMAAPAPIEESDSLSFSAPAAQPMLGQFFTGQFYVGQFYVGQFYAG